MKTTELTDIDGDALTITQRLDATWITCTKGNEEVTVGPLPTDAIRNAFDQPMGGDDMDGGVTAAAIEAEVITPERARSLVHERDEALEALETTLGRAIKAERERDEADRRTAEAEAQRDQWMRHHDRVDGQWAKAERELTKLRAVLATTARQRDEADKPRPLTADDVTDVFVDHVHEDYFWSTDARVRLDKIALKHALLDAVKRSAGTTRPEGAEGLDEWVRHANSAALGGLLDADERRTFADHLAAFGYSVGGDR